MIEAKLENEYKHELNSIFYADKIYTDSVKKIQNNEYSEIIECFKSYLISHKKDIKKNSFFDQDVNLTNLFNSYPPLSNIMNGYITSLQDIFQTMSTKTDKELRNFSQYYKSDISDEYALIKLGMSYYIEFQTSNNSYHKPFVNRKRLRDNMFNVNCIFQESVKLQNHFLYTQESYSKYIKELRKIGQLFNNKYDMTIYLSAEQQPFNFGDVLCSNNLEKYIKRSMNNITHDNRKIEFKIIRNKLFLGIFLLILGSAAQLFNIFVIEQVKNNKKYEWIFFGVSIFLGLVVLQISTINDFDALYHEKYGSNTIKINPVWIFEGFKHEKNYAILNIILSNIFLMGGLRFWCSESINLN